ncbi:MAG: glycosyltransferase [Geminicoccaceae bacterium]|nr:glycosyltransferase [Geminicoccaceae bacterium]
MAASPGGIAFFFAARGGGVQNKRIVLANALNERGFDIACVLPEAIGPFLEQRHERVDLVDLGTRNPLKVIWRLASYLRRTRPAVLISSQQHTNIAALIARLLARSDVPIAITQHNALSELYRQSRRRSIRWVLPRLSRLLLRRAERVVAVSAGVADDLAEVAGLARGQIEVIYNPVVTPDIATRAAAPSGHPWLDEKDQPVVLSAGNLIPIKDFPTLFRAFARARQQRPMRLVMLGEGVERDALERLGNELGVAGDIDFTGFTRNPYAFMARADLFALSSQAEGLSNVIVEALACGCPVVATDCRFGPGEILQGGRFGRLVTVGDATALSNAILDTLDEEPEREVLRRRAMDFSLEGSVERYVRLIEDLQAGARRS